MPLERFQYTPICAALGTGAIPPSNLLPSNLNGRRRVPWAGGRSFAILQSHVFGDCLHLLKRRDKFLADCDTALGRPLWISQAGR